MNFKRKPVSHETLKRQLTNINFVKNTCRVRITYRLRVTLECGHIQIVNGGRLPKLVTCKACKDSGTINPETRPF